MTNGLTLVKKAPARAVATYDVVREGSTGRVVAMLPRVWAVGQEPVLPVAPSEVKAAPVAELAFYRKYTEAMLRRYVRMSTGAGRVPSLLGRELFRGNVSHYQVQNFEDVVVFCMDVEKCLARLDGQEKELIRRIALQHYTQGEAAAIMGVSLRHAISYYQVAIDKLTRMFLDRDLLEPLKGCQ